MVIEPITHIEIDERGVAWIGNANTKVIEIAADQAAYGWDGAEIHAAHPHLSLAQIHAALAYYHDHKPEFDATLHRQLLEYRKLRSETKRSLTRVVVEKRLSLR